MITNKLITLVFTLLILTMTHYVQSEVNSESEKDLKESTSSSQSDVDSVGVLTMQKEFHGESNRTNELEMALLKDDYIAALEVSKLISDDSIIETIIRKVYNANNDIDILMYLGSFSDVRRHALVLNAIYMEIKFTIENVGFGNFSQLNILRNNTRLFCNELKLIYTIQKAEINSPELSYELRQRIPNLDQYINETISRDFKIILGEPLNISKKVLTYFTDNGFVKDAFVELNDTKEEILFAKYELVINKTKHLHKMQCFARIAYAGHDINVMNQISDEVKMFFKNNSTLTGIENTVVQLLKNNSKNTSIVYNTIQDENIRKSVINELYKSTRDFNKLFELSDHVNTSMEIYNVLYERLLETRYFGGCELLKLFVKLESVEKQFENPLMRTEIHKLLIKANTALRYYEFTIVQNKLHSHKYEFNSKLEYNIVEDSYKKYTIYVRSSRNIVFDTEYFIQKFGNKSKQMYCYKRVSFDIDGEYTFDRTFQKRWRTIDLKY